LNYNAALDSCYSRSQGSLGSSNGYGPTFSESHGILSNDPAVNPHFYDWTVAFVKYCDGTVHIGHKNDPIDYVEILF